MAIHLPAVLASSAATRPSAAALVAVLTLCACASTPPAPPGPPSVESRTAAAEALGVERQWLQSWFRGTPVVVAQRGMGALSIDVPREFCFEAGQSSIKPALAAVLDKVALSLGRLPQAGVPLLAAPGDGAEASPLALQRATQVREHLRSRGVAEARLGQPSPAAAAAVALRIDSTAP